MNRGIRTSHTGSLPRPDDLLALLWQRERGAPEPGDAAAVPGTVRRAVRDVLQRQVEIGLDLVNDGEMSKISYSTYVKNRLSGFDGAPSSEVTNADLRDFPAYAARNAGSTLVAKRPACNGPVAYQGSEAVAEDLGNFRDALDAACAAAGKAPGEAFVTAASPGESPDRRRTPHQGGMTTNSAHRRAAGPERVESLVTRDHDGARSGGSH